MIELERVSKIYSAAGGSVRALDDVSVSISAGEFVAVCGPSGCGKSTFLSLAGGLDAPTTGVVRVDGTDLGRLTSGERAAFRARRIGFVFQLFHLLPYLNVMENVLLAALPGQGEASRRRAAELLDQFGLAGRLRHRASQLSVGEKQRTALARALLNEPRILLADEPTGNLDAATAESIWTSLAEFHRRGGTVLLVTHDQSAAAIAQRQITLRAGRVDVATASVS